MASVRGWCQNYTLCFFNDRFSKNNWKDNHMSWLVTPMLWMKFELLANIIFRVCVHLIRSKHTSAFYDIDISTWLLIGLRYTAIPNNLGLVYMEWEC